MPTLDSELKKTLIKSLKKFLKRLAPALDIFLSPLVFLSALLMKMVRRCGIQRMPLSRLIFRETGIFPLQDHYYEPLFQPKKLKKELHQIRRLPGIHWNDSEQLALLEQFHYLHELEEIPLEKPPALSFYSANLYLGPGDGEFLYQMIRHFQPAKIVEVGCGFSTLMAMRAVQKNRESHPGYHCELIGIEPYEVPWLEQLPIRVMRQSAETVDHQVYLGLEAHDILFIDSSHMIRPQGDVLLLILEILPQLKSGVIIHFHDIFSPTDYPKEWITQEMRFWNEQYLLEAFLSFNPDFRILGALNYLRIFFPEKLFGVCPVLAKFPQKVPGSFWIQRK
ncbi:MAG: class I SAM-dependent methyltransferase [Chitinophagaceae bacterium]